MKNLQAIQKIMLGIWIVGLITMLLIALFAYSSGKWDPFNKVDFIEFYICSGPDPISGIPQNIGNEFSVGTELFLCGKIATKTPVSFPVYWYKDSNNEPFYQNPVNEEFNNGYIFSKLEYRNDLLPGNYHVDVNYQRKKIITLEFRLIEK